MSESKALVPVEQKAVEFYDDEIVAVRVDDGTVLVPIRPICDLLGLNWSGQRQRIMRDAVLSKKTQPCVVVTHTQGQPDQRREMLTLPLDYISGFLFGINANRAKESVRAKLIQYQEECYQVLDEAFREGRLTSEPSFSDLLNEDTPAVQAYRALQQLTLLARNQVLLEARIGDHALMIGDLDRRLEQVEDILGDEERHVTPDQASQISQAVKTVAMRLSKKSGRNEYGGVYGELYRKFGITSYKQLPAAKFEEAMSWLNEWRESIEGDVPF
jgi:DNA-directed RNA polymerase beta' subunit